MLDQDGAYGLSKVSKSYYTGAILTRKTFSSMMKRKKRAGNGTRVIKNNEVNTGMFNNEI